MGSGQHGQSVPLGGLRLQAVNKFDQGRPEHVAMGLEKGERNRGVVDVLGGESEVYKLRPIAHAQGFKAFF